MRSLSSFALLVTFTPATPALAQDWDAEALFLGRFFEIEAMVYADGDGVEDLVAQSQPDFSAGLQLRLQRGLAGGGFDAVEEVTTGQIPALDVLVALDVDVDGDGGG